MSEELHKLDKTRERDEGGRLLPGQESLNPNGRPAGKTITELLRKELLDIPEGEKESKAASFVEKLLLQAIDEGDKATQKLIMNYIDGMPQQSIEHSGNVNISGVEISIRKDE